MVGRGRVRAVDRDDVHAGEHLVEAVPIGGLQLLLDLGRDPPAVVIVDLQAEGLARARHRLADPAHADDAEPLAVDAVAEHPGRRPAVPLAVAVLQDVRAFDQTARHGEDQRHGHVGGVLGQHARRVGDDDAAVARRLEIDIVDAGAEIGDQLQLRAGSALRTARSMRSVTVGTSTVGGLYRLDQFFARHRLSSRLSWASKSSRMPRLDHVRGVSA